MRILLLMLLLTYTDVLESQVLSSFDLDTAQEFVDLTEALKNPEIVYKLNLRKKKLKAFPKEILQLKNLNSLNISKNKIHSIPSEISQLKYLQKLDASKNYLDFIPVEIGELTNLTYLRLGENNIVIVPSHIGKLKKLEYLDLWSNEIESIPEEFKNLTSLKKMDLRLIQFSNEDQKRIRNLLPGCTIYFSMSCGCH